MCYSIHNSQLHLGGPYCCSITEFNNVESNMRKRRKEIQEVMTDPNEAVFSMSTFPRLGCDGKGQP